MNRFRSNLLSNVLSYVSDFRQYMLGFSTKVSILYFTMDLFQLNLKVLNIQQNQNTPMVSPISNSTKYLNILQDRLAMYDISFLLKISYL